MESIISTIQEIVHNIANPIATFAALVLAIGPLAGFMIANIAAYNQAEKYGIPFSKVYIGLATPISLMVQLLSLVVVGLITPVFIVFAQLPLYIASFLPAFIVVGIGSIFRVHPWPMKKIRLIKSRIIKLSIMLGILFIPTASFLGLFLLRYNETSINIDAPLTNGFIRLFLFVVAVYISIIFIAIIWLVIDKLMGIDNGLKILAKIEGENCKKYFIAMRCSSSHWICLPYEMTNNEITLIEGEIKIKSLDELKGITVSECAVRTIR